MKVKKKEGNYRNLAAAYNLAISIARDRFNADLFVSLQDYVWIPKNGLRKFKIAAALYPQSLHTGIMSIYQEPSKTEIVNPSDPWTIFGDPWYDKPSGDYYWEDVRKHPWGAERYIKIQPLSWEQNWAAIPKAIINDKEIQYDESFDEGVAYENCDYAIQADQRGYSTILDTKNEAYGYPHKLYFADKWEIDQSKMNIERFHHKWNFPIPEDQKGKGLHVQLA
jgi:hypothetical protein